MNIFVLDTDPEQCARDHCDKHVVKMILESAQLLSTAHHVLGNRAGPNIYKRTHVNHPCAKWVRGNAARYRWLYRLFASLCREYTARYGKRHASERLLYPLTKLPRDIPNTCEPYKVDGFVLAMPDEYKDYSSATKSYRAYYMGEKQAIAMWAHSERPDWWR